MNESKKVEVMQRLRADGTWDEANKFREVARLDFKSKGMSRDDAKNAAWDAMAAAFPPRPTTAKPSAPDAEGPTNAEEPIAEQDEFEPLDVDELDDLDC